MESSVSSCSDTFERIGLPPRELFTLYAIFSVIHLKIALTFSRSDTQDSVNRLASVSGVATSMDLIFQSMELKAADFAWENPWWMNTSINMISNIFINHSKNAWKKFQIRPDLVFP
jgi:hypothetical protein